MMPYAKEYFSIIKNGLDSIISTDEKGNVLNTDIAIEQWADQCEKLKNRKGIFFFCGNGASATMAEHMSHDCFQNAGFLTATCSETSHITAISNDMSYEDVFSYRISKMLGESDMLVTISSSGNSPNIIKAIAAARKLGAYVITLSGKNKNNQSRNSGNLNFYVPLNTYGLVESTHAVLLHCWLDRYLDKYMGGRH